MLKEVYAIAIASRLATIGLAIAAYCFTGSYDSSGEIQLESTVSHFLNVFLRWDALYFLHIAENGYIYEQETAFFPVMPLLARFVANTVYLPFQSVLGIRYTLLLSGITVSNISFVLAAGALYKLTITLLPQNRKLAMVSAIAFCLSPPAMFMSSFYTESLFAFLSFTGMKWVAEKKYLPAALIWGLTSAVRSNALIYSGFFFYDLVWMRIVNKKSFVSGLIQSVIYTGITLGGFALFQYHSYMQFCTLDRPWCSDKLPLLYTFVQKEYWDVGFLAYYETKQIPNFVLAAPIVLLSIFGLRAFIKSDPSRFWSLNLIRNKSVTLDMSYFSSRLSVYMYLWAFLLVYVLTSMHVQVIIRFFTSVPPFYWFVAHVWIKGFGIEKKDYLVANVVLGYFVLYGLIGIVLFAAFLPPA